MKRTEKMENHDHVRDATKRMPRGYAYMRFRNDGFTFEVKFPRVNEPSVESAMRKAMQMLREATKP